jgi:hypothetical protein
MLMAGMNMVMIYLGAYYVYLVVVICEATMGLGLLISLSRFWGNEVVKI